MTDLAADMRSLALVASVPVPASHETVDFLSAHGATAATAPQSCASCHTADSCTTCHVGTPQVAAALPSAGPGRGTGAVVLRDRPPSHDVDFLTDHGSTAAARPETCAGCHVRSDCHATAEFCTSCHASAGLGGGDAAESSRRRSTTGRPRSRLGTERRRASISRRARCATSSEIASHVIPRPVGAESIRTVRTSTPRGS